MREALGAHTVGYMPSLLTLRSLSRGQLIFDIAAPSLLFLVLLPIYLHGVSTNASVNPVVLLGMCLALAFRRLHAGVSLSIAWTTAVLQMALGLTPDPSNLAILAILYATASYGSTLVRWLGFASTATGALVITLYVLVVPTIFGLSTGALFVPQLRPVELSMFAWSAAVSFLAFFAMFALSWTLGLLARTWRTTRETRRAQLDAEKNVVVEQERNRIARDMHDVVAHSLAVVIAQADGARYARAQHPEAVDEALATISTTAREALGDVRLLLGQLRHSEEAGPQPVLADLERLLEQFRGTGLAVSFEQTGIPLPLPTGHQLAIYRIVQEALTNALRHGDTTVGAIVRIDWQSDAAELSISNALGDAALAIGTGTGIGPGTGTGSGTGHGIPGMRERAAAVRGTLSAQAVDRQFMVEATIPAGAS